MSKRPPTWSALPWTRVGSQLSWVSLCAAGKSPCCCLPPSLQCSWQVACTDCGMSLADIIDKEKTVKHSKLAEGMEEAISEPLKVNVRLKVKNDLNILSISGGWGRGC